MRLQPKGVGLVQNSVPNFSNVCGVGASREVVDVDRQQRRVKARDPGEDGLAEGKRVCPTHRHNPGLWEDGSRVVDRHTFHGNVPELALLHRGRSDKLSERHRQFDLVEASAKSNCSPKALMPERSRPQWAVSNASGEATQTPRTVQC